MTQKCLGRGYVSCQEGILLCIVFLMSLIRLMECMHITHCTGGTVISFGIYIENHQWDDTLLDDMERCSFTFFIVFEMI